MTSIVLNAEQVKLTGQQTRPIPVCDEEGNVVGSLILNSIPKEEIEAAQRSLDRGGPTYTTAEVMKHFENLSRHREQQGPLTSQQAVQLTRELLFKEQA